MATLEKQYYPWLVTKLGSRRMKYKKLLKELHNEDFLSTVPLDQNREVDGVNLRRDFADETGIDMEFLNLYNRDHNASVLEVMVALSARIENIMADDETDKSDRWFWSMVLSMGLDKYTDDNFDVKKVKAAIQKLINRDYSADGKGGLFYIPGFKGDLREKELWYQAMAYLNGID